MDSNYDSKDLVTDIYPFFRLYKDNQVERFYDACGLVSVPPTLEDPETGVSSKDVTISPHVSARLYLPKNISTSTTTGQNKLPIFVYYHGGGLVQGSAFFNFYHRYMNVLVSESNAIAISVEYRLAPEHDVSTIYEDCWTALQWVASHASENFTVDNEDPWLIHHGDFSRLSIAGDSAGGNIVYHMAMRAGRNKGIIENVTIFCSIFAFPYFLIPLENIEETVGYKIWAAIKPPSESEINSPMINPLADKSPCFSGMGCCKLLICIGEQDEYIPREIGNQVVDGIKKSGWTGDLEFIEVEGEGHCFQLRNPQTEKSQDLIKRIASFIQNK